MKFTIALILAIFWLFQVSAQAPACHRKSIEYQSLDETLRACTQESQKQKRVYLGTWIEQQRPICEQSKIYGKNQKVEYKRCMENLIDFSNEVLSCEHSQKRQQEAIAYDKKLIKKHLTDKGETSVPLEVMAEFNQLSREASTHFPSRFQKHQWRLRAFQEEQINAMAGAGGDILISQGVWQSQQSLQNQELLAILAHEMGHVFLEHSLQLGCLALEWHQHNSSISEASEVFQEDFTPGFPRRESWEKLSQKIELEADEFAVELLHLAGHNPKAMSWALKKLIPDEDAKIGITRGSHPDLNTRIQRAKALAEARIRNQQVSEKGN